MNIFIDIGHPAHVHYFKNFIEIMKKKGHRFYITARDKEMTHYLLNRLQLPFFNRGKGKNTSIGKLFYLIKADTLLLREALKFKPDLFMSFGSPYAAQVSSLLNKPHIVFDDTENAKFGQMFYKPFSDVILSPTTFSPDFGKKHIKYNSYIELCYLHPNYFKLNECLLSDYGIDSKEKYVIVRFVAWNANHDIGHNGISYENKIKAVEEFSKYAKVYISSENELPPALEKYRLKIKKENIHHVLGFASLFYGESATMASESAVLGTPSVYVDNVGRGYTSEQEQKYQIVFNYTESDSDQLLSIKKGVKILKQGRKSYATKRTRILDDKICTTDFMVWFIGNYPNSVKIMKENPIETQKQFL